MRPPVSWPKCKKRLIQEMVPNSRPAAKIRVNIPYLTFFSMERCDENLFVGVGHRSGILCRPARGDLDGWNHLRRAGDAVHPWRCQRIEEKGLVLARCKLESLQRVTLLS